MAKAAHRSTILSLLPFDPGEVQQELIATLTGAKVKFNYHKFNEVISNFNQFH